MLLLSSTSDLISIITGSAGLINVHASFIDLASGAVTAGRTNTQITTAATTTVVASPAASTTRNVKSLKISNDHATVSNLVTLQHTDGTTVIPLESVTLAPGERLGYEEGVGIRVYDALGREKLQSATTFPGAGNTGNIALNSVDTYLLGLPVAGRIKAGSALRWRAAFTKTAAGVAAPIFTVRAGTAGTTSDTARNTFTAALAQTAATDTALLDVETVITSFGASGVLSSHLRFGHSNATTGFATSAQDQIQQGQSSSFDNTVAGLIIGLSVNPGASGVWTCTAIALDAINFAI